MDDEAANRVGTGAAAEEPQGLKEAGEALAALYEIHDFFFTASKAQKREMLREASMKVLSKLEEFGEGTTTQERAKVAYIRGRALDVYEEYNKDAEAALAKAVKLEPSNVDAWNGLGHSFWKKKDLNSARDCFQQALVKATNKDSLRKLSMVLRQLPAKNIAEAQRHVQDSVRRAKDAVKVDLTDPESWYVLGNAYVTVFFKVTHSPTDLERALQAYHKAEVNGGESNPDLWFNKANVLQFQEDFAGAAAAYRRAVDLDPSLPGDEAVDAMQLRVRRTVDLLHRKGRVKEKRLSQLVAALGNVPDLPSGASECRLVTLAELNVGQNQGVAVALKLVLPLGQQGHPPNSFIMADKTSRCTVLSVYHLDQDASRRWTDKDTFVVLSPMVKRVNYCTGRSSSRSDNQAKTGEQFDGAYDAVQIMDPGSLFMNGKPIESSLISPAALKIDHFDA